MQRRQELTLTRPPPHFRSEIDGDDLRGLEQQQIFATLHASHESRILGRTEGPHAKSRIVCPDQVVRRSSARSFLHARAQPTTNYCTVHVLDSCPLSDPPTFPLLLYDDDRVM